MSFPPLPSTAHSQLRYQSDNDLEILRRRLSNAPRPLKKRSSITEPEGPQGPNIQKLLYQRLELLCFAIKTIDFLYDNNETRLLCTKLISVMVCRFNTLAGGMEGGSGKTLLCNVTALPSTSYCQ